MLNEFRQAFQRHNNAHIQLIIINVVIFLFMAVIKVFAEVAGQGQAFAFIHNELSIPAPIGEFITRPWTLITYAFLHDLTSLWHIIGNMLMLYWFGQLFKEYLGSDKLIAVYILGAIAGGVSYLLVYNTIPYYMDRIPAFGMIGASAAVYAITVAVATLLPDYTFFMLFLGPVKIKYIALVSIVISFVGIVGTNEGGNVAHLGGALIGFIYTKQLQAGINWGGWITATIYWFRDLFRAKSKVKVTYRNERPSAPKKSPAAASATTKASQEEIDMILDKISDRGYESLSKEEKQKLFNASKK